jgi:acyl-CoA thioesterase
MPDIGPVTEVPIWDGFGDPAGESAVWKHFERRPKHYVKGPGYPPGTPEWSCWVRLLETFPADDLMLQAARAVLWMDMAPWNAGLIAHPWPTTHIAPTLDLTVQFQSHLYASDVMGSDWLLATTASPVAAGGLFGANSTLWSESGKLVAVSTAQALFVPNPHFGITPLPPG